MNSYLAIFPDEAMFSVVQRLMALECASTYQNAAKSLFNSSTLQFSSVFPSVVPVLSKKFDCNPTYWIKYHSVLPHYRVFTPKDRFVEALSHLEKGEGEKVFKDLSLIANRQCSSLKMRFCPQCAIEDNDTYGLSYWHVMHQLSGVFVCLKHRVPLISQSILRKRFDNWPCNESVERRLATQIEMKLVRFVCYFQYHRFELFRRNLCDVYKAKLYEMGFITKCAHVRMKALRCSMIRTFEPIMSETEVKVIFENARHPLYPSCVLANNDSAVSPLKHLLMMVFLFESVSDLIKHTNGHVQSNVPVNSEVRSEKNSDIADIMDSLNRGESLRRIAEKTRHSITYVKRVAITSGVAIDTREQKLFATERRQITILLLAGYSTNFIAHRFTCSTGAVEQILSQHPDIVAIRKLRRLWARRREMRGSLLDTVRSMPNLKRNEIKKVNGKAYLWLFKHDKQWLYSHLPKAIPRALRRKIN